VAMSPSPTTHREQPAEPPVTATSEPESRAARPLLVETEGRLDPTLQDGACTFLLRTFSC
jgi:hypothetical protein